MAGLSKTLRADNSYWPRLWLQCQLNYVAEGAVTGVYQRTNTNKYLLEGGWHVTAHCRLEDGSGKSDKKTHIFTLTNVTV